MKKNKTSKSKYINEKIVEENQEIQDTQEYKKFIANQIKPIGEIDAELDFEALKNIYILSLF